MSIDNKKIHILGGGPAGMALAHYANKKNISFSLFESSDSVGGNAKTIRRGDFLFDTGAHRFHDKNEKVTLEIKEILKGDLHEVSSPSKIFWNNNLIDFPLSISSIFKNINLKTNFKIIVENLLALKLGNKKLQNFQDFAYCSYGKTISDLFLINYSEKLWGESASKLSVDIAGGRLNNLDLRSIFKELFLKETGKTKHLDGNFLYPKYGFGSIFTSIYKRLDFKDVFLDSSISKLILKDNRIRSIVINDEYELPVNNIVSTLPLSILISRLNNVPEEMVRLASNIRYRSLKLVVFFLNKKNFSLNASLYFPDKNIPFTRIYEPKNRSEYMAPDNQTSIVVEVPYNVDKLISKNIKEWNTSSIDSIKSFLINNDFICDDDILDYEVFDMPHAYPILDTKISPIISKISSYLDSIKNLSLLGRSAEFKYLHVHDLFSKSEKIVNTIVN